MDVIQNQYLKLSRMRGYLLDGRANFLDLVHFMIRSLSTKLSYFSPTPSFILLTSPGTLTTEHRMERRMHARQHTLFS